MGESPPGSYQFGGWLVEPSLNQMWRDGQTRHLTPLTMNVLAELLSNAGKVVATERLLDCFWSGRHAEPGMVARCIKEIRHALADDARRPSYIETVRKRGYRTIAPVETDRREPGASQRPPSMSANPLSARVRFPFGSGGLGADGGKGASGVDLTRGFAVSPNGRSLVSVDRNAVLHVQHIDRTASHSLAGTEGARDPFYAPDGRRIGFFADGRLKTVSLDGGSPMAIAPVEAHGPNGATWLDDGTIVFGTWRSGLKTIPASGGAVRDLTSLDLASEESHRLPHRIGGHAAVLFNTFFVPNQPQDQVWVLDVRSGERRYLFDGFAPRYVAVGFIVYVRVDGEDRGSLWAMPFDPQRLQTTGAPRLIESAVQINDGARFSTADYGVLVYLPYPGELFGSLELHEPTGRIEVIDRGVFFTPRLSHDGRAVAVAMDQGSERVIGIYSLGEQPSSLAPQGEGRITGRGARAKANGSHHAIRAKPAVIAAGEWPWPVWSSDDRSITFQRDGSGLLCKAIDRPEAPEQRVVEHKHGIFPAAWVNCGQTLLYNAVDPEKGMRALALDLAHGEVAEIGPKDLHPSAVALTPDETWMAFVLADEVYISRYPDPSVRWRVAIGRFPRWGGKDKLYFTRHETLWCVDVVLSPNVDVGAPRQVADLGITPFRVNAPYDADARDRIVIAKLEYSNAQAPVLAINWEASLA